MILPDLALMPVAAQGNPQQLRAPPPCWGVQQRPPRQRQRGARPAAEPAGSPSSGSGSENWLFPCASNRSLMAAAAPVTSMGSVALLVLGVMQLCQNIIP